MATYQVKGGGPLGTAVDPARNRVRMFDMFSGLEMHMSAHEALDLGKQLIACHDTLTTIKDGEGDQS